MNSKTYIEVGIVLLPVEETKVKYLAAAKDLRCVIEDEGIVFPDLPNIPHVSLYQMNVSLNTLQEVEKILNGLNHDRLVGKKFPMDRQANREGDNIFWRISSMKGDEDIKATHFNVINCLKPLRAATSLKQLQDMMPFLNDIQRNDVEEYGVYWGLPHNFDPHITLEYNTLSIDEVETILKKFLLPNLSFDIGSIALVRLGYYGNVETILWQGQ